MLENIQSMTELLGQSLYEVWQEAGRYVFPLFCLSSAEKSDVFLIITFLCALGIDLVIVTIINELLEPGMQTVLLGASILFICSLMAFSISYPITVGIFKRKEY